MASIFRTPRSRWSVLGFAGTLLIATPFVEALYYSSELRRGVYPTNGDSISIPLIQTCIGLAFVAPAFLAIAWLSTRRYVPGAPLLGWDNSRPLRSLLWTLLFAGIAVVLVIDALGMAYHQHLVSCFHRAALTLIALWMRATAVANAAQHAAAADNPAAGASV